MDHRRGLRLDRLVRMAAVLAIAVLLNTLAAAHFVRLDLTHDRVHSLSQPARQLVQRLQKPLLVKVWFTHGLEAPYNNNEQVLLDKLDEFRAWSGGRMEVEVVDPTGDEDLEKEARSQGVEPIRYRYRGQGREELRRVYMGAVLIYGDRQQVLPAITQVDSVEYEVARAIQALLRDRDDRRTIGFLTGHGEPDLLHASGPLQALRDRIQQEHDLVAVSLGGEDGVPDDVDALLVINPQVPVGLREQVQLDQFLMSGRPEAFFLASYKPDLRRMRPAPVDHGLDAMLGHYGVRLDKDLVVDRTQNGMMRFPVRQGRYVVQVPISYPLIPKATKLSRESVIVQGLDYMLFPFASSLSLASPAPDGITFDVLAASSAESGRIKGVKRIDPASYRVRDPTEQVGSFVLAVAVRGSFTSFFAGRSIPGIDPGDLVRESDPTRLVVSGSADMVANNPTFMLNLCDWLTQDESLIGIRSRAVQVPGLRPQKPERTRLLKLLNLLGPAGLLLLAGAAGALVGRRRAGGRA